MGVIPPSKTIVKKTISLAWPSVLESLLIALIGAIDMMMVGGIGKEAIAAVGITTQPKFIVLSFILALNISVTILVSHRLGEKKQQEANIYLRHALIMCVCISAILTFFAFHFAKEFLIFAGANEEYLHLAIPYFKIIIIGNFFYSISLTITAAQRGAGNTIISMKTNLAANVVNLILNALLIHGLFFFPKLGVVGAGIATMIGNIVALMIALTSVMKPGGFLHLSFHDDYRIKKNYLFDILTIAKSSLIEQVFLRIGFFMYAKTVADLGTISFSANQICMNVMTISFAIGDGLQIANTSLVGQSLGAKRADMAMIYGKVSQRIGMCLAICTAFVISYFHHEILGLFTRDAHVIEVATIPMYMLAVTVCFQIPQVIVVGSLRGAGDVKYVAGMMLISVTLIRPGLAQLLCYGFNFGLIGAWIALFLDQVTRFTLSFVRYHKGKWTKIQV